MDNKIILGQGYYYDMDFRKTHLNNNVIVVGSSGTGKTRSIVIPNILQATGSYIIADPGGYLYRKCSGHLKKKGYIIKKLNLENPSDPGTCSYNPFAYIRNDRDIRDISDIIMTPDDIYDAFYDKYYKSKLSCILGYVYHHASKDAQTFDPLSLANAGHTSTAIFVVIPRSQRSVIVDIFFFQAINELLRMADSFPFHHLPVNVRFIMDGSSNIYINDLYHMIALAGPTGISFIFVIQKESQLFLTYGEEEGKDIINGCGTYVYMGGKNDIKTARNVAERADMRISRILHMHVGKSFIFRHGQKPVLADNFDPRQIRHM